MWAVSFDGFTIEEIAELNEDAGSRIYGEALPRAHGAIAQPYAFMAPRAISMSGAVNKSTEASLKTYLEDLARKLNESGRSKLILRDDNRYYWAIKSRFASGYRAGETPALRAGFSIEFFCNDPFKYAAAETAAATWTPAASGETKLFTNGGKFRTPPRIEIKAVGADKTNVLVSSNATGLLAQYTGTVPNGQVLTIDGAARTVTLGGSNALGLFAGTLFDLEVGDNTLTYVGPTGVDINLFWTDRWSG